MTFQEPRVRTCAIVPAYNEEETIGDVIRVLALSDVIDEIFVVSDGSTDQTCENALAAGASQVFQLPKNSGANWPLVGPAPHINRSNSKLVMTFSKRV